MQRTAISAIARDVGGTALVEFAIITSLLSVITLPAFMYLNSALSATSSKQLDGYPQSLANPSWQGRVQAGQGGQYCNAQIVVSCP